MNQLFNIGNASDVGLRKGEKKYEAVGEQIELEAEQRYSILRKNTNTNQKVHMKIIKQHRIEVIRKELYKKLRKLKIKKKERKTCTSAFRNDQKVFTNKHTIDEYIDEYWVLNCP